MSGAVRPARSCRRLFAATRKRLLMSTTDWLLVPARLKEPNRLATAPITMSAIVEATSSSTSVNAAGVPARRMLAKGPMRGRGLIEVAFEPDRIADVKIFIGEIPNRDRAINDGEEPLRDGRRRIW